MPEGKPMGAVSVFMRRTIPVTIPDNPSPNPKNQETILSTTVKVFVSMSVFRSLHCDGRDKVLTLPRAYHSVRRFAVKVWTPPRG